MAPKSLSPRLSWYCPWYIHIPDSTHHTNDLRTPPRFRLSEKPTYPCWDYSSYFFKCWMLKTGKPGYLSLICKRKTFGLIRCVISNGPIHHCFSLFPAPFASTQSRECGFTRTQSPCLNSGTGLLPLLNWCAWSSCAPAIALRALSLCMARVSRKLENSGESVCAGWFPFLASFRSFLKMKMALSSAHHPQHDGQTEILNRLLTTMLRAYISDNLSDWSAWLHILEFAYNNSTHSSTGTSPNFLVYGFHLKTPLDFLLPNDALASGTMPKASDFVLVNTMIDDTFPIRWHGHWIRDISLPEEFTVLSDGN